MEEVKFIFEDDLAPFVNCIMVKKSNDPSGHTNIPLYADGYPGIMFQQSKNGFYLLPKNKALSALFLYGQTLTPISLDVKGPFEFIVVQLYPFASKYLLGIDPKKLNDDCFDLLTLKSVQAELYLQKLTQSKSLTTRIAIISDLMRRLIKQHQLPDNDAVQQAISIILKKKGDLKIKQLTAQVHLTERTFERKFMAQVGLSPKQFAKIIQFQSSLKQLSQNDAKKLVEIGMDSGFSDQSHFIRAFKQYTGQTPSYYLKQVAL